MPEETRVEALVLASDPDGDRVTFRVLRPPKHGQASLVDGGTLSYLPAKDFHGDDVFTLAVSDGRLMAQPEVKVTVSPVNDAPVARPVTLSGREDTAMRGASSASDVDGDALSFRVVRPPARGTATVDAQSGVLTYQPALDVHGADTFSVEASDGALAATFEVSVSVAPVNDAPTAESAVVTLDEDGRAEGQVQARDVDGDPLSYRLVVRPAHGLVTLDAAKGSFVYVPAKDFFGDDACSVEVSDGRLAATAQLRFSVTAVNDAPEARPLSLSTREDVPVAGLLVARDVDSVLAFQVASAPQHGEAQIDPRSGAVTFRSHPDFHGSDAFSVEVGDGALSAVAQVSVTVTPVNDAPVVQVASLSLDEDTRLEAAVVAKDVDGDPLVYRLSTAPAHGVAAVEVGTGTLTYTPAKDFFGADALSVEVSDGQLKGAAKVQLEVRPVNDAPVARPVSLGTLEDTAVRGTVVGTDVDGPVSYRVATAPTHGQATVDAKGGVAYQPDADFFGADGFVVEVSDGQLAASAQVTVTIAAVNDAPVARSVTFTLEEDGRMEERLPFTDVDGDALTARLVRAPGHGAASVEASTGRLTYAPVKDFHGEDAVEVEVSDGRLKAASRVTLQVTPVNDAPVAKSLALSTSEDTPVKGAVAASDVDLDALSYRVVTGAAHGVATVDAASGVVTLTPATDWHGSDGFTVEVSDGKGGAATSVVTVAVAAVDDAPVVRPATLETAEDTPATATLPGAEADGERLTFRLLTAPRLGVAELLEPSTGAWRFSPRPDLHGEEALAFDVTDGRTTVPGVVTLRVTPVNDAPTLAGLELSTPEDRPVEGRLQGADVDGDALTFLVDGRTSGGRAVMVDASEGRVRFEPARDFEGRASFNVVASDGKLRSPPVTVTVTVEGRNDAPVASDSTLSLDEDEPLRGTLLASDVDGDALTYRVVAPPAHGAVTLRDPRVGAFDYLPAPNYAGTDAFQFSVADPAGATSSAKVRLIVEPVNDAPMAVSETVSAPFRGVISGRLKGHDRESRVLTFRVIGKPSHGQFRLLDAHTGAFSFATDGQSSASSVVRFVVSDGALTSEPGEVTFSIRNM